MSDWQPIETAPKDGTFILTLDLDGKTIEINRWVEMPRWHFEPVEGDLYLKVPDEPVACWSNNAHRATHWMPLPSPPESAS